MQIKNNNINDQITSEYVILINVEGINLGRTPLEEAISSAKSQEVDLVQVQENDIPICLRVSGGTSILNKTNLLHEGIAVDIEDAIRLNVSAVAFSILVGQPFERDTLLGMTEYIDEANRYGIPVLAVTAVGKGLCKDARYLSLASRMAAELGASIVKTYYCKDFEKIVDTCPVPIVIAGGKKIPEKDALQMAYDAI